uniref:Brain-enriched guanylate kinase-associated protein n=1 Tax=Denticeps clupeoides TaxID=299321 RepID=A0AAY4DLZ8_9TELE
MKKIYIGKTALKQPRNGYKHPKRSSLQEQKEDLRKRLSYTTQKLELLETEFDSTRQYLETELRRAQEELEKFTDKLRRIQSSYAALQRINQDLEEKIQRTTQHHEEEKRALSREIIVLNNHLMETKLTIKKLRDDNDLYRKDCNLAAQLLQCGKSQYRSHKLSELPIDFRERVSSHMEKHGRGQTKTLCQSPYTDAVPTAIIAKVLEKPEPGSSCPVTRSPSPQPQETSFFPNSRSTGDHLQQRVAYKMSDLYCSDTALYCPTEERRRDRWQERRQSADIHGSELLHGHNSTDSNPEDDVLGSFHPDHLDTSFHKFVSSLPASSSYSSFSAASDDKGVHGPSSTLSSSQQALFIDWREGGDYEHKSSSYEKDSPGFSKSHSFQHVAHSSSQNVGSLAYTRSASCFSDPYHSPRITSSRRIGDPSLTRPLRDTQRSGSSHVGEDELSGRWRQMSVEELNAFSYRGPGRVSPCSFSEQQFAMGPAKIKLGPLYSSFQEGDDIVFRSHMLDPCFVDSSASPSLVSSPKPCGLVHRKPEKGAKYRASKGDSMESSSSLFHTGSSKDKESLPGGNIKKDYVDVSPKSSAESLHQSSLETSSIQHYPREKHQILGSQQQTPKHYQKFCTTGLTRKDSLTKAQLYGTLLN